MIKCVLTLPYINFSRLTTKKIWSEQNNIIKIPRHIKISQEKHFCWASLCTNTETKGASDFPKLGLVTVNEL